MSSRLNIIFSALKVNRKAMDQSGQIAVVVFLIMAVLLVVGLSLASRTSQEIEQAGQAEDTTRVFNAAESGIEKALDEASWQYDGTDIVVDGETINDAQVDLTVTPTDDASPVIQPGQSMTVYTQDAATIDIRWGADANCANNASIIVTRYIKNGSNYSAEHDAYNPFITSCRTSNQFISSNPPVQAGGTVDGVAYTSRVQIAVSAETEFIRIRPLYASAQFKVDGADSTQAHTIRSQATDVAGGSEEVRTIEVTRTRPAPPSILDYALYSGGTLVKN